jgi:tetratricopeptide (TPR) repeat protein
MSEIKILHSTFILTLFSLGMAILFGILILIVTRRPHWWLRYKTAEGAFYLKIGMSKKFAAFSRRFSESRMYVWFLWLIVIIFLVEASFSGRLYFRVKHQIAIMAPPAAKLFYDLAANQIKAGDFTGAITNFSKVIEVYSNYAEAYSFRSRAKYNLQDYNGAIADATKAIELNPTFEPAYNILGFSKFALKDYAGSIDDFNISIKLDSSYAPAYYQRGIAEANLKNYTVAIKNFTQAIKLKQDYAMAYYDRGLIEQNLTNYTAAIMDFSSAIKFHSDFANAYNYRGLAKWYLKNYNGTIADCTEAIKLNPKFSYAYSNRGLAKNNLADYTGAIVDLDKSIELNRSNEFAYCNRGDAKYHLKDYGGAIADFNKAIELNAKDALAYEGLGYVQNNFFQFESALKNFRGALQLDPSLDYARFNIWLIRSRLGDGLGATEELKNYLIPLKNKKHTWSNVVELFLVGSLPENLFLDCAKSSDQKTQIWWRSRANYYVGMKHLIEGDKVGAMDFFQQCLNTKETNTVEYASAEVELNALKKVIPP